MTKRLAAVCVVVVMALAACSAGADPKPKLRALPKPGECIAKEVKDLDSVAPDYATAVNCKKAHVYEIVDVLNVPKKYLVNGSKDKRLDRRNELAKSTAHGPLAKEFRAYADRGCLGSTLLATGLDPVTAGEKAALNAGVRPVLVGASILTSAGPAAQWAAGKPSIICSFRYTVPVEPGGPQGRLSPIRSPSAVPSYRDLLTKDFPAERRACGVYDKDFYMYGVMCSGQHTTEVLFSYDGALAFGTKFAKSVDDTDTSDAQWDRLVQPCVDALDRPFGPDVDAKLVASVYLADDWSRSHKAYCLVTPESDKLDLPPGSVVGQMGTVKEVPHKSVDRGLGPYAKGT